jgi:hypothetical protein
MKRFSVKTRALVAAAGLALSGAAFAQQAVQEYQYPSQPGSASPPSTLRILNGGAQAPAAPASYHDTPESLAEYQRCRTVSDHAVITNADRQNGVMQCLKELEARRQGAPSQ